MDGLTVSEQQQFEEKMAAATIVNNAVIKCTVLGLPIANDNVVLCVGDFFDPGDPRYSGLLREIEETVVFTLGTPLKKSEFN